MSIGVGDAARLDSRMSRRVAMTGLGTVTALGIGVEELWRGLCEARSGIGSVTRFDASGFSCRFGAEVKGFSAKDFVPKNYRKAVKVMARDTELAVGAAKLAVEDAGLQTRGTVADSGDQNQATTYPTERMGCHIGAGLIAAETEELTSALATAVDPNASDEERRTTGGFSLKRWGTVEGGGGGMNNLQPLWMLKYLPNMPACHVTIIHGAEGPSNTLTCAEASGLLCIGESARVIERGAADMCFSGSAESKLSLMGYLRLSLASRLAVAASDDCSGLVRPFHHGSGGVPGEAGGIIVLEELNAALRRSARVYAHIAGFGAAHAPGDGWGKGSTISGIGIEIAVRAALRDARLTPDDIDAIVPHGSGVPASDAAEAAALRSAFGAKMADIPLVTWTQSLGDCHAGNGGVQTAIGALCLSRQMLPATLRAGAQGSPPSALQPSRSARLRHVLVCSGGVGGQCAAIVLAAA